MIIDVEIATERGNHWTEQSQTRRKIEATGANPYQWLKCTSSAKVYSHSWRVKATVEQATMLRLIAVSTSTGYYEKQLAEIAELEAAIQEAQREINKIKAEIA